MIGKTRWWPLLVVGCLLLMGGTVLWKEKRDYPRTASDSASDSDDPDAIYEAVFRHVFQHNGSGAKQQASKYFLMIENQNPAPLFLQRFAAQTPTVEKGSEYRQGTGLLFMVGKINHIDASTVEVNGGYYEGNMSAARYRYTLSKQRGKWVVVEKKEIWVS